jgi:chromosome segregation ATPase
MLMIYVLIGILVAGTGVFAWIFYIVKKEGGWFEENQVVPITDLNEIRAPHQPGVGQEQNTPDVNNPKTVVDILQKDSFATTLVQPVAPLPASPGDPHSAEEVRQLHEELRLIREKALIQANNAIDVINKLREENEALRSEIERSGQKVVTSKVDEDLLTHLRAENIAFKEQLSSSTREAEDLRQQLSKKALEAEEELARLKETVQRLEAQNVEQRLNAPIASGADAAASDSHEQCQKEIALLSAELEALRLANEKLRSAQPDLPVASPEGSTDADQPNCEGEILRQHVTELEKQNSTLEENNKFLQYELTKSRAQAAGLERICENSRKQFEEIARGIREVETDNQALKSQTHHLERSLVDFKKLNTELLKREKLTQFEIEKNLDQIRDLEDIYGVFRSRLERLGISEEDLVRD